MSLPARHILDLIRKVAPESTAAEWDRTGLQCGDPDSLVDAVVLALDVRPSTIQLAVDSGAGLIIAHHPLIFEPLRRIDPRVSPGRELISLIEQRIVLYVAHTNADASRVLSMNDAIGARLPLKSFSPATAPVQVADVKLVTFVPVEAADKVRDCLARAGAGKIGEYESCSFNLTGTGTFYGSNEANPTVGQRGRLERVEEVRLEMVCPKRGLDAILKALWDSHPYEEVAYDLYPLSGYQPGIVFMWEGELEQEMPLEEFARVVRDRLGDGIAPIRFAGNSATLVKRVAWCSGGGKSLIQFLDNTRIDVYLTGDTGHHDALECLSKGIALVDLDHYYTERLFLNMVGGYLSQQLPEGVVRLIPDTSGPVFRTPQGCYLP